MHALAEKAKQGTLSTDEQQEIDNYETRRTLPGHSAIEGAPRVT